jgi:hypothetical protein
MGIHGLGDFLQDVWNGHVKISPLEKALLETQHDLQGSLLNAIFDGEFDVVRYLLDAGISPHVIGTCTGTRALAEACGNGRLDIAKLLRSCGAKLQMSYEEPTDPQQPSNELLRFSAGSNEVRNWLLLRPPEGSFSAGYFRPPAEGEEFSAVSRDRIPAKLVDKVECWQDLRRRDVKDRTRKNWRFVHDMVVHRAIAFYWIGETQKRLCADDGRGRAVDAKAFKRDFEEDEEENEEGFTNQSTLN